MQGPLKPLPERSITPKPLYTNGNGAAHPTPISQARNDVSSFSILHSDRTPEKKQETPTPKTKPKLASLEQLLNEPEEPIEFLIERLVTKVGMSLWGAKPKVGKSTLLRTVSVDLAAGGHTVVYLALEESRQDVLGHFRKLSTTTGPLHNLFIQIAPVMDDGLFTLTCLVEEYQPAFVVVDPLQRLLRAKDLNDYSEVYNKLSPFGDIARTYGFHLAWSHHLTKYEGIGGDASDAFMASTAIYGAVDCGFLIRKKDGQRVIRTDGAQRGGVDLPEHILAYDDETGRAYLGDPLEASEHVNYEHKVLDALTETGEGGAVEYPELEEKEIRARIGGNGAEIARAIRMMVDKRDLRLLRSGGGKRGDPYHYRRNPHLRGVEPQERIYAQNVSCFSFGDILKARIENRETELDDDGDIPF